MERPSTRRGSAADFFEGRGDAPKSATEIVDSTHASARPFSRMATEYAPQKYPMQRGGTAMRATPSDFFFDPPGTSGMGPINRMSTAASRPGSRAATAMPTAAANVQRIFSNHGHQNAVAERPTTQQGLGGLRSAFRGPQRQVQDKSYFLGLLRTKMSELGTEITRLARAVEKNNKEMQNLPALESKVKEMAVEITDLQGKAADLNFLQEKISTSNDPAKMEHEHKAQLTENGKCIQELEHVFDVIRNNKEKVNQLEKEIKMEHENVDQLMKTLPEEDQERYSQLKKEALLYETQVENASSELMVMENRSKQLEADLSQFPVKEELYRLYQSVAELENKYQAMMDQDAARLNPEEERAQLLASVHSDNGDIAAIDLQMKDFQNQLGQLQSHIKDLEQSAEESQTERGQKYRDLRRREEIMDEFLSTWEENCLAEKTHLTELESHISNILLSLAKQQSLLHIIPSVSDFTSTKDNLLMKEGELEKSRATVEGVAQEYQRLKSNLQKLEELEKKISEELDDITEKLATLETDLVRFADIKQLRQEAESNRNNLVMEQQATSEAKDDLLSQVNDLESQNEALQRELSENETHMTLHTLEEKLTSIETENTSMKDFIAQHQKTNVEQRRQETMLHVANYLSSLRMSVNSH